MVSSSQSDPEFRRPIIIHEDDSSSSKITKRNDKDTKSKFRRCLSVPTTLFDLESIMKLSTVDESLHSTYGSDRSRKGDKLKFDKVKIREYARTVGDNPSCSSGPPVRYVCFSPIVLIGTHCQ